MILLYFYTFVVTVILESDLFAVCEFFVAVCWPKLFNIAYFVLFLYKDMNAPQRNIQFYVVEHGDNSFVEDII